MAGSDPLYWFAWHPFVRHLGLYKVLSRQFGADQHVPRFSHLSVITYDYGLHDIDIVITDHAFGFWQECRSTINYPTCPGTIMSGPLWSLESGGPIGTHASLSIYRFQILLIHAFQFTY